MLTTLFTVNQSQQVGAGIRDARFGSLDVVVKEAAIEEVYSEFIASRLGPMFGVNTVPGIPQSMNNQRVARWLSTKIGNSHGPLPAGSEDDWDEGMAQIRGFDVIIGMSDRHTQNYTIIDDRYYIFDHGFSLAYSSEGLHGLDHRRLDQVSREFPGVARSLSSRSRNLSSRFLKLLSDEFELFVPEASRNRYYRSRREETVTGLPKRAGEAASRLKASKRSRNAIL